MCSKCTFQSYIINFQTFMISFVAFHAFTNFSELYDPENEKKYKWTLKRLKVGWYNHFTHIECAKNLTGLRQRLDALRVQNGQSLSKYQGFIRKLICYTGTSIFFKLIWTPAYFCIPYTPFKATSFPTRSDIICCFSVIYRFVERAKWRWNWKSLQNELWKCWSLAWYHHFTRIACAKE